MLFRSHDIQWRIFAHAESGDRLFLEGVDEYRTGDGKRMALPYAGVLEFRIAVSERAPEGVNPQQMRDELKARGPVAGQSPNAAWFPINDVKQWADSQAQRAALEQDPAAFFATREAYKRQIPGRLVGRSHECDFPASVRALPAVTRPRPESAGRSMAGAVAPTSATPGTAGRRSWVVGTAGFRDAVVTTAGSAGPVRARTADTIPQPITAAPATAAAMSSGRRGVMPQSIALRTSTSTATSRKSRAR